MQSIAGATLESLAGNRMLMLDLGWLVSGNARRLVTQMRIVGSIYD